MAVPPATALHMGYLCMIPACQHYPAMLLPLALSHLESSACISAEGSVSHLVCGSQTVSLQRQRLGVTGVALNVSVSQGGRGVWGQLQWQQRRQRQQWQQLGLASTACGNCPADHRLQAASRLVRGRRLSSTDRLHELVRLAPMLLCPKRCAPRCATPHSAALDCTALTAHAQPLCWQQSSTSHHILWHNPRWPLLNAPPPSRCWKKGARVFSNSYGRRIKTNVLDAPNLAQKKAIETLTKQGEPGTEFGWQAAR
jgi:hypothetical protein